MLQPLGEDFKHLKRVRYLGVFFFFRHFSAFLGDVFFLTVWGCFFGSKRAPWFDTDRGLREPIF